MNQFFHRAYELALIAYKNNFIPVGAVIEYENKIVSEAHNELSINHAEILAILRSNKHNLVNHSIYITHEPCNMCIEALKLMRIKNIYFGSYRNKDIKYSPFIIGGIHEEECSRLLRSFFLSKRL